MIYAAFDIGNVLVTSDFQPFLRKLSHALNITLEEAGYFMSRTQKLHDLGYTVMSDELRDHFKIKSPVIIEELINDYWNRSIFPADYILEFLEQINRENNVQVALLSNIGLEHSSQIETYLNPYPSFKDSVKYFSCRVGARKPSTLYYQSFLQMYPDWKGCVYVDDLQENLDVSKTFGFRPYRFALSEIVGTNYVEKTYSAKLQELKEFILTGDKNQVFH